jgi:hypothetical protein
MTIDTTTEAVERQRALLQKVIHRIAHRDDVTVLRIPADANHDADMICDAADKLLSALAEERDALAASVQRLHEKADEALRRRDEKARGLDAAAAERDAARVERDALAEALDLKEWCLGEEENARAAREAEAEALRVKLSECEAQLKQVRDDWELDAELKAGLLQGVEAERDAQRAECLALASQLTEAQAHVARLRRGWLSVIQVENSCPATGGGCLAKRCGCVEEMEMLLREYDERAALTEAPRHD